MYCMVMMVGWNEAKFATKPTFLAVTIRAVLDKSNALSGPGNVMVLDLNTLLCLSRQL